MSDLEAAVFGGQLMAHVIAGDELTTSVVTDAAMTADIASGLIPDQHLTDAEQQILLNKVAENTLADGGYEPADLISDQLFAHQADSLII